MSTTKLSLDALLVLDAIARKGSFAAAAEELHRVPSAITYTVQKLEQDLDVQLFDRSGHRARLTRAGEELLRDGPPSAARGHRHRMPRAAHRQGLGDGAAHRLQRHHPGRAPVLRCSRRSTRRRRAPGCGLSAEILGGCWDALFSGRADLVIGAPGDSPPETGAIVRPFGEIRIRLRRRAGRTRWPRPRSRYRPPTSCAIASWSPPIRRATSRRGPPDSPSVRTR